MIGALHGLGFQSVKRPSWITLQYFEALTIRDMGGGGRCDAARLPDPHAHSSFVAEQLCDARRREGILRSCEPSRSASGVSTRRAPRLRYGRAGGIAGRCQCDRCSASPTNSQNASRLGQEHECAG